MKVLISAGGTAGHINPAIAIGKYIMKQDKNNEVLFVGSDGDLEKRLYKDTKIPYSLHSAKGLERKHIMKNFGILLTDYKAYKSIYKAACDFKPDIGISCGGYISFMAMEAVKKTKAPFIVVEQNAYPGITTKLLSRDAKKYCLAFEKANEFLKYPNRAVVTGNPVREEFSQLDKIKARQSLGISEDKKMILCFGGSLGAMKLDEAFLQLASYVKDCKDIILYIGTGKRYYNNFVKNIENTNKNVIIKEYIDNMPTVLCACDVVVSRAGAMTVSEICAAKKPCVLVPSPNVTADHQTKNANVIEKAGGGIKIKESELDKNEFCKKLVELVRNEERLKQMRIDISPLAVTDGDKRIYDVLKSVLL